MNIQFANLTKEDIFSRFRSLNVLRVGGRHVRLPSCAIPLATTASARSASKPNIQSAAARILHPRIEHKQGLGGEGNSQENIPSSELSKVELSYTQLIA